MKRDTDISQEVALIWNTANDVLRDIFQRTEYPDIIYPMVLIRRIEGVMIAKTEQLKKELESQLSKVDKKTQEQILNGKVMQEIKFNNISEKTLSILAGEGESSIKNNFIAYLNGYTDNIKIIIDRSGIRSHINKLAEEKILYTLIKDFSEIDLSPEKVSNIKMGYVFEELVRKFSEANNAEAGEHYTPREVIDLMTHMLDMDEKAIKDGQLVTIYDPACGSGGMLSAAKEFIEEKINPNAKTVLYGQEVNDKTWAVAQADLLLKGETAYITKGDTLYEDGAAGEQFDFMLSNPPYGKSWKKIQKKVLVNSNGRFDVGQPRSSDGQLLFTLHMISKMKPAELGGSTIAIVHNGSPLFSGDAGSGESEIRRYILENDWLETIVALPTELFYNTGIATYIWLVRNNKSEKRKGKIQLIDASSFWKPMKRSLGNKRRRIDETQINEIIKIHKSFEPGHYSKIFELEDFAFRKVFLDLEETDENGNPITEEKEVNIAQNKLVDTLLIKTTDDKKRLAELKDKKGKEGEFTFNLNPESELATKHKTADTIITIRKTLDGNKLGLKATINVPKIVKDTEYIPWRDDKEAFLKREVEKKWEITKEEKGYEIPFTKHFYVYQPLRDAALVTSEIAELENSNTEILNQLGIAL
ncbi:MAG: class I SAM-dependent DNA methyltransferase [Petrimonas sp.]|nr:class I SAM-dependent DNA methyltransferase [Petrimonas sp.]MEA4949035.1 class I SAM-dependent DNA methyltransferase [Petrimonas sp.]